MKKTRGRVTSTMGDATTRGHVTQKFHVETYAEHSRGSSVGKGTLHLVHSNFSTIFLVVLASAVLPGHGVALAPKQPAMTMLILQVEFRQPSNHG